MSNGWRADPQEVLRLQNIVRAETQPLNEHSVVNSTSTNTGAQQYQHTRTDTGAYVVIQPSAPIEEENFAYYNRNEPPPSYEAVCASNEPSIKL